MRINVLLPILLVSGLIGSKSFADTTIQFYEPYSNGIVDNLANASGVAANGMRWGVIVSTTNATFAGSGPLAANNYDAYAAGSNAAGFLSVGGVVTDDYYIPGALTVDGSLLFPGGDNGDTPGNGSILNDIAVAYTNGISNGDRFALVWFASAGNASTAGSKYGFIEDASFVLPSDTGASVGYTTPFVGADALHTATNTFQSVGATPEPSRALLVGIGALGLVVRRRRRA